MKDKNTVAQNAVGIMNWVNNTPGDNINSVEIMNLAFDVLAYPSEESKACLKNIWEERKPSSKELCQASEESAYTQLMEKMIYAEEPPIGILENRKYIQFLFGINVYTRIAEAEDRKIVFDNQAEMDKILVMQNQTSGLAPDIKEITDTMVDEVQFALSYNKFENQSVSSKQY